MEKEKAFTLAEVLIVLAIIGVVAALTMPMLMNNYQKTAQLTALKKIYSGVSEAIDRMIVDEEVDNFSETSLVSPIYSDPKAFFKKYFKVSKYCGNNPGCFPPIATSIDKTQSGNVGGQYCVTLKDGSSICANPYTDYGSCMFNIDTNGIDKPNIGGRDIFTFQAYQDGSLDEVSPTTIEKDGATAREGRASSCGTNFYGAGCVAKIINEGWKMDY